MTLQHKYSTLLVEFIAPRFDRAYQKIMLKFEVTGNSPDIIEDTNVGGSFHNWTTAGNAFLDTADKAFGNSSLKCDGTGDYITTPDHEDFTVGSNDFTVQFWFKVNDAGGSAIRVCGQMDSGGTASTRSVQCGRNASNFMNAAVGQGGAAIVITGTTQFTNAVNPGWFHYAFVRTGDVLKMFINGTQEGGDQAITGAINDSSNDFSVGRVGEQSGNEWNGWIDEFEFLNGVALYTEDFSVANTASSDLTQTYRFCTDADYVPRAIAAIPSVKSVSFAPATINPGTDLGQRSTVTITFNDHKHIFAGEDFDSGTFWGKFRARYGLKLRGREIGIYTFTWDEGFDVPQDLEGRFYTIESTDGPNANGEYKIIAKDILKLADGDRAQAPVLSNGFLVADIASGAASATLSPSGIGNEEYPASGYAAIGGKEIVAFTRVADALSLTRGQFNTVAQAHSAQDRVQLCLEYDGEDPADILFDLLTNYAGVDSTFIDLTNWQNETNSYYGNLLTALIAEPTSVNTLISEIIEQAALVMWWDDEAQLIRLQVLRNIPTTAHVFTDDSILADSLSVQEQPDKRISHIYHYFGKINPLVKEDQIDNYRSTAFTVDETAATDYGSPAIKKIFSRWVPNGGRSIAERLNDIQLGRFRDPPRRIKFKTFRYSGETNPSLGGGFRLEAWLFQEADGSAAQVPIQVVRVNPMEDIFDCEAEEMLFTPYGDDIDPTARVITFDADENNINLYERHNEIYSIAQSGDTVTVYINEGVTIGSDSPSTPAFDVGGTWSGGVTINIIILGKIIGCGGQGGTGGVTTFTPATNPTVGGQGGTAFYTRQTVTVTSVDGEVFGGGGGGGGGASSTDGSSFGYGGGGGGGGAGVRGGFGGNGGFGTDGHGLPGAQGSETVGGVGGAAAGGLTALVGGGGGVPGGPGSTGISSASQSGASGGAAGYAVDGLSFVNGGAGLTLGDIRGSQVS